jgi:release factor glutamine methyltransferase
LKKYGCPTRSVSRTLHCGKTRIIYIVAKTDYQVNAFMNIKKIIAFAGEKLKKFGLDSPFVEAEILLSAVLKKNKEYLLSHPDDKVSFWQNFCFQEMVKKRLAGYSSAVLAGHKWFYGLDFAVNKNVLVPRPETELIIDEIIQNTKYLPTGKAGKIPNTIIDVGTGSGCIVITLAKLLKDKEINFYGLDISRKALAVARKNAIKNGVAGCIKFLYSDLLNIIDFRKMSGPIFITANLPYLTAEQIASSSSIQKEPRLALFSGIDGLDHYRRLLGQIRNKAREQHTPFGSAQDMPSRITHPTSGYRGTPPGRGIEPPLFLEGIKTREIFLFCEIDESQKNSMANLIKQEFPDAEFEFKNDLGGHCRLAIIKLTKNPLMIK